MFALTMLLEFEKMLDTNKSVTSYYIFANFVKREKKRWGKWFDIKFNQQQ